MGLILSPNGPPGGGPPALGIPPGDAPRESPQGVLPGNPQIRHRIHSAFNIFLDGAQSWPTVHHLTPNANFLRFHREEALNFTSLLHLTAPECRILRSHDPEQMYNKYVSGPN